MNLSVAIATYNGEKYIKEQIDSILSQLDKEDEIVIYDDGSTDNTIKILREYEKIYSFIKVYEGENVGFVKNFERAIDKCSKDLIALCDQDDIWFDNKVSFIKDKFKSNKQNVLLHNALIFKEDEIIVVNERKLINNMRNGVLINILKSCYWGCCMVFRKEFKRKILPFPKGLISHDQWIGLIAEIENTVLHEDLCLIKHRYHSNNVTKKSSFVKKVSFRINLVSNYIRFKIRNFKYGKNI